jgi:hypothetical protein
VRDQGIRELGFDRYVYWDEMRRSGALGDFAVRLAWDNAIRLREVTGTIELQWRVFMRETLGESAMVAALRK